jgi:DNA topoisomerase IA
MQACVARQQLDLRVGAAFTRFQCLRMQQLFPNLFNQASGPVSYGMLLLLLL